MESNPTLIFNHATTFWCDTHVQFIIEHKSSGGGDRSQIYINNNGNANDDEKEIWNEYNLTGNSPAEKKYKILF